VQAVDFQVWREVAGGIEQTGESFVDGAAALDRAADLCRTGTRFVVQPYDTLRAVNPAPVAPVIEAAVQPAQDASAAPAV
jgi:hypothetical protein